VTCLPGSQPLHSQESLSDLRPSGLWHHCCVCSGPQNSSSQLLLGDAPALGPVVLSGRKLPVNHWKPQVLKLLVLAVPPVLQRIFGVLFPWPNVGDCILPFVLCLGRCRRPSSLLSWIRIMQLTYSHCPFVIRLCSTSWYMALTCLETRSLNTWLLSWLWYCVLAWWSWLVALPQVWPDHILCTPAAYVCYCRHSSYQETWCWVIIAHLRLGTFTVISDPPHKPLLSCTMGHCHLCEPWVHDTSTSQRCR